MFLKSKKENQYLLKARAKALRESEDRVEKLTNLRKQDLHNNYILLEENRMLVKLLSEIHRLSVVHLIGYEKVTLEKIKELTRGY